MEGQPKKIFSVTLALIVGVVIILFAWKGDLLTNISFFPKTQVAQKNPAVGVATQKNTRLLPFWRNLNTSQDLSTSTTDTLVYDLISNYTNAPRATATSTLSDSQVQAQAQALADKARLPDGPKYKISDLKVSSDNSIAARTIYGKTVAAAIRLFIASQTKSDLSIVLSDPQVTNSATRDAALAENVSHYKKLERALLAISVPSSRAGFHLRTLQAFSDMEYSLGSMNNFYGDPMRGVAALSLYRDATKNLFVIGGAQAALPLKKI